MSWDPASWQSKAVQQLPVYLDPKQLRSVEAKLQQLPPLVVPFEVDALKQQLAMAAKGQAFLLQGGDCAERFTDCNPQVITNKLKILLQMSIILLYGLRKPIVRIGRIAGQYAKPRSSEYETQAGVTLPSYRGDIVNQPAFSEAARTPDPERMYQAYSFSAQTLNYLRALVQNGFADLHHPEYWDMDFITHSPSKDKYQELLGRIARFG